MGSIGIVGAILVGVPYRKGTLAPTALAMVERTGAILIGLPETIGVGTNGLTTRLGGSIPHSVVGTIRNELSTFNR